MGEEKGLEEGLGEEKEIVGEQQKPLKGTQRLWSGTVQVII